MTVSRGSEPLPEQPQPGDDPNPTSVNIAEYERLANERDKSESEPKTESKTAAKKSAKN